MRRPPGATHGGCCHQRQSPPDPQPARGLVLGPNCSKAMNCRISRAQQNTNKYAYLFLPFLEHARPRQIAQAAAAEQQAPPLRGGHAVDDLQQQFVIEAQQLNRPPTRPHFWRTRPVRGACQPVWIEWKKATKRRTRKWKNEMNLSEGGRSRECSTKTQCPSHAHHIINKRLEEMIDA